MTLRFAEQYCAVVPGSSSASVHTVDSALVTEVPSVRSLYELAKPNLTLLVVVTAVIGFYLGSGEGPVRWLQLVMMIVGTALTSAGACALNMFIEREIDGLMPRTRKRPIPSGRVSPESALFFALITFSWGFGALATFCGPIPAVLSMLTGAVYAFAYTPLKRRGPISIWVGAIPGAVPPMIGWSAATGGLDWGALALFLVMFLLAVSPLHRPRLHVPRRLPPSWFSLHSGGSQ